MGFFRRIFGAKKGGQSSKEKRRWSFTKSSNTKTAASSAQSNKPEASLTSFDGNLDPNKHAIAVAAATAAVAEAALAAAHAAAEVVRLTSGDGRGGPASAAYVGQQRWIDEQLAAVKIQSAFRGYLARRALRALKALVKLQALVRGHIVRKQSADMLRRMQTLVKVQARARANRAHMSESLYFGSNSSLSRNTFLDSPSKGEYHLRTHSTKFEASSILKRCGSNSIHRDTIDLDNRSTTSNWLDHWMEESRRTNQTVVKHGNASDENNDKILEVDTWKPHLNPQRHILASDYCYNHNFFNSPSKLSTKSVNAMTSNVISDDVLSLSNLKFGKGGATALTSTENSPQVGLASYRPGSSGRKGPFTPMRSEYNWGVLSEYTGYPSYMANTESSRAKVRSQSAPRQRLEFERHGSTRRSSQGVWDLGNMSYSENYLSQDVDSRNKGFPASERLSRVGSSKLR